MPLEAGEEWLQAGNRRLRRGMTTGSCAALAAGAAARLLLLEETPRQASLRTPCGVLAFAPVEVAFCDGRQARCAVRKDAGDDPDVTDGVLVFAQVSRQEEPGVCIEGGEGVGRVTLPGLEQPVGAAAINRVPRQMISQAVQEVCEQAGYTGGMRVCISIPGGAELAQKTFNPRLGIEGGLSVLGTSGVVEPMSEAALRESIALELRVRFCAGARRILLTPGNYGQDFLRAHPRLGRYESVKCSNYIGEALDLAAQQGFEELLLVGHVGKLVKVAAGVMNTHSRVADCRMEVLAAHAALAGAPHRMIAELLDAPTTDAALERLKQAGLLEPVMRTVCARVQQHLQRRAGDTLRVGAVLFHDRFGLLGVTGAAEEMMARWETGEKELEPADSKTAAAGETTGDGRNQR